MSTDAAEMSAEQAVAAQIEAAEEADPNGDLGSNEDEWSQGELELEECHMISGYVGVYPSGPEFRYDVHGKHGGTAKTARGAALLRARALARLAPGVMS